MKGFVSCCALTVISLLAPVAAAQISGPSSAADSLALTLTVYGVALSNGTQTAHAADQPELVCVMGQKSGTDPSAAVLTALQENRTLLLRPISACRTDRLGSAPRSASLVVDTLTGKRGISISAGEPKFTSDSTFTVETGYYQHGLSSAGWLCEGNRTAGKWQIVKCKMLWIS